MCSKKALLVGDSESVSNIFRQRVMSAGHGANQHLMVGTKLMENKSFISEYKVYLIIGFYSFFWLLYFG